jgi:hypothetical protein
MCYDAPTVRTAVAAAAAIHFRVAPVLSLVLPSRLDTLPAEVATSTPSAVLHSPAFRHGAVGGGAHFSAVDSSDVPAPFVRQLYTHLTLPNLCRPNAGGTQHEQQCPHFVALQLSALASKLCRVFY